MISIKLSWCLCTLKWKCCHSDEIFITVCTWSCHLREICQHNDNSLSVQAYACPCDNVTLKNMGKQIMWTQYRHNSHKVEHKQNIIHTDYPRDTNILPAAEAHHLPGWSPHGQIGQDIRLHGSDIIVSSVGWYSVVWYYQFPPNIQNIHPITLQ